MRTTVPIDRALSKLGLASRAEARVLIREGRVRANGRLIEQVGERVKLDAKITGAVDFQALARDIAPKHADALAPAIEAGADAAIRRGLDRFVASDRFAAGNGQPAIFYERLTYKVNDYLLRLVRRGIIT